MTFIFKDIVDRHYQRSRQVFYQLVRMGAGHRPATTDKIGPTLFDERRLPLVAAIIGSEPNASIANYDLNISGVIRYSHANWMETVRSARRKGPTSMDRFENGGTKLKSIPVGSH